jgi:sialidase-1
MLPKTLSFLLCLIGLTASAQTESGQKMTFQSAEVRQARHPMLIGQTHNAVLQLTIKVQGTREPLSLQELWVSSEGTTYRGDIQALRVFYTGDSAAFFTPYPFDLAHQPQRETVFRGNLRLQEGDNHFWLSCELKPTAHLDHKIALSFRSFQLSNQQTYTPIPQIPYSPLPLAHALRQPGQDGVHTHRIPGLATTNDGTLIAVYDLRRNGSVDLQEDIDVGMSRSTDGGLTWEPMRVIMDMGEWGGRPQTENGIGDPSVLVDRTTNAIWVAGVWAHGHPGKRNWHASRPGLQAATTSQFVLVKSEDNGLNWSEPINITAQIKHPDWHLLLQGPGKGITLQDGTLVFPAQFKDRDQVPHSTLIYSQDHGQSWQIGTGAKSHTTESQVVELADGSLMLNMRDDRGRNNPKGGFRSVAITKDLGQTWTEHPTSANTLTEPVCMGSLIKTDYRINQTVQPLLIFSNPAVSKAPRREITIKLSLDEGMSWPEQYHTLVNEDHCYGYSCLSMIDEERVGILYESNGGLIFQRFSLEELLGLD